MSTITLLDIVDMINDIIDALPNNPKKTFIMEKRIINKLDYELRDQLLILQEQLTQHVADYTVLIDLCCQRGMNISVTRGYLDSWGMRAYYLCTPKGIIMFG